MLFNVVFVCEHVTYTISARDIMGIANTPSRFASSRKNIYTVVSGKPANDLQTNMCNSGALALEASRGTTFALTATFSNATELSNNIYTLLTRLLKISKLCRTLTRSDTLFRGSDFRALHYALRILSRLLDFTCAINAVHSEWWDFRGMSMRVQYLAILPFRLNYSFARASVR